MKELILVRGRLLSTISLLELMSELTNSIIDIGGSDFTHKCRCPFHKSGNERTPSFWFSQTNGKFHCFGCSMSGDTFDILSITKGAPWFSIVEGLILDTESLNVEDLEVDAVATADFIFEVNLSLSTQIRDLISTRVMKGFSLDDEMAWGDTQFRKIDSRFASLTNSDRAEIFQFKAYMEREIGKRV